MKSVYKQDNSLVSSLMKMCPNEACTSTNTPNNISKYTNLNQQSYFKSSLTGQALKNEIR